MVTARAVNNAAIHLVFVVRYNPSRACSKGTANDARVHAAPTERAPSAKPGQTHLQIIFQTWTMISRHDATTDNDRQCCIETQTRRPEEEKKAALVPARPAIPDVEVVDSGEKGVVAPGGKAHDHAPTEEHCGKGRHDAGPCCRLGRASLPRPRGATGIRSCSKPAFIRH